MLARSPAIATGRFDPCNTSGSSCSWRCELSHWQSGLLLREVALTEELHFLLESLCWSSQGGSHRLYPISSFPTCLILLEWQRDHFAIVVPNCAMSFRSGKKELSNQRIISFVQWWIFPSRSSLPVPWISPTPSLTDLPHFFKSFQTFFFEDSKHVRAITKGFLQVTTFFFFLTFQNASYCLMDVQFKVQINCFIFIFWRPTLLNSGSPKEQNMTLPNSRCYCCWQKEMKCISHHPSTQASDYTAETCSLKQVWGAEEKGGVSI